MPRESIIDCDVLVLGTGAAGMAAGLAAAEAGAETYVISKMPHRAPSPTTRAYGDVTWSTDETTHELARQVVETGGFLSDQRRVRQFAEGVPAMIDSLRLLGAQFDAPRPAGEDMPGVVRWSYRGVDSGEEVLTRIHDGSRAKHMWLFAATEVLVRDGAVCGVAAVGLKAREPVIFRCPCVILATGGGAAAFERTDNPPGATGDGIAMAYDAGAELVDLELISFGYPKGRVSDVLERGGQMREELLGLGHAHYFLGGVRVDENCETAVRGLYAAGEVTGGLFGAGRLGGSALADCFIFGRLAGHRAAFAAEGRDVDVPDDALAAAVDRLEGLIRGDRDPAPVHERIREIAWRDLGPVKTQGSLRRAIEELDALEDALAFIGGADRDAMRLAVEARQMHTLARLTATASLQREETRGCYWRADHPQPGGACQLRNIIVRRAEGGSEIASQPPVMTELTEPTEPRIGAGCFGYIVRSE
ncbi:MAG: FAD-binding protein [Armatimonadota bacterium]|jgi:succinate dehydrogenase/fumarate reductase flavoprotein subunit